MCQSQSINQRFVPSSSSGPLWGNGMSMRVCCFRVTVPAVQYDSRISSGSRDRIPCRTLSRLFDALGSLARGQLPAFLPRASGIRSHPPNPRELFRMGYMKGFTSVRICTGRITRTVTPEDSVLFARYLRVLVASQQVISMSGIYRGVRTRVYPGRQARPIRCSSVGRGPARGGAPILRFTELAKLSDIMIE